MGIAIPQVVTEDRASGALVVDGSLKFDSSKTTYLSRTPGSASNRKTWTWSGWVKRSNSGSGHTNDFFSCGVNIHNGGAGGAQANAYFDVDGTMQVYEYSGGYGYNYRTTQVFRDLSDWYHVVISLNTTDATEGERVKIYVNGSRVTSFSTSTAPNLNFDGEINNNVVHYISDTAGLFNGYMSQATLIDGLSLGPGYFGYTDPLTGTWRPKKFKAEGTTVNDGTVWSAGAGANFDSSNPATNGFNGNPATYARTDNANVTATVTFSKPIHFSTLVVRGAIETGGIIRVNGVDVSSQYTSGTSTLQSVDLTQVNGVSSPLTSISLTGVSGAAQPRFSEIVVDGVVMQDSTTTNLDFGTNGFYLPMDGNSPIEEDQSGKGNNWTPVNFGGSNSLDKATGAKPILNTLPGGTIATPGVFGSKAGAQYTTTSATNSGGKYVFENEGTQPTFSFIRGATYTFDYNASTGHPLRFATAADAAGSTQYTDGTNTSVSNVISFTVPHNAPNTLYYYCTNHSGMGNSISVTTDETKADPYAWKNVLALPLVDNANDVSGDMNCTTTNDAITNNSLSFNSAQSVFYNRSADPDGSQYLSGVDLSSWNTEQPWTIEFWWYRTGANTNSHGHFVGGTIGGTNQYGPTYRDGSHNDWQFNFKGQSIVITPSPALVTNKWEHHAFTSNGNNISYFRDGVFQNTTSASSMTGSWGTSNEIFRGGAGWSSQYVVGHVCDMRVYTVEKYTTAGFIPASTNPDILPDTPSGVSGGSKLAKIPDSITEGAVTFDGAGDYLVVEHSDMAMGTGDFTVEFSVYNTINKNYNAFISTRETSNGTAAGWVIASDANGDLYVHSAGAVAGAYSGDITLPLNRWCHVAYTRSGGTHRLFLNGVAAANSTNANKDYTEDMLVIGDNGYAKDEPVNGFISNVRVIKGTALYTANFTPPSAPLTNVTNTKLLCCQSNTSAIAAAVTPVTITAGGNAVGSTFSPFNTDINTVRGQETGYCTINPFDDPGVAPYGAQGATITNGNLDLAATGSYYTLRKGTIGIPSSGKWYYESTFNGTAASRSSSSQASGIGLIKSNIITDGNAPITDNHTLWLGDSGYGKPFGSATRVEWFGATIDQGDVLSLAIDMDASTFNFRLNNISVQSGNINTTEPVHPFVFSSSTSYTNLSLNFGQKPFKFPPPAGFQPLNAANVRPETVIARPDQYVGPLKYTGKPGGSQQDQDKIAFTPDMVWVKRRNASESNKLYDTVRGKTGSNFYHIESNNNTASAGESGAITEMLPGGFYATGGGHVNSDGQPFIAWMWRAGGGNTTGSASNEFWKDGVQYASAAAANITQGTLPLSAASIGTKQGFSICQYTSPSSADGSTWGHGLSQAPDFIISRMLNSGGDWSTYNSGDPTKYMLLNSNAGGAGSSNWTVTGTTVTMGAGLWTSTSQPSIAYHWHNVPGLQKFGKYKCNGDGSGGGDENGPFVELGFRPSMILFKGANYTSDWTWIDNERCTINYNDVALRANYHYSEIGNSRGGVGGSSQPANYAVDFLSNGFKIRASGGSLNSGTNEVVYAAWAEAPSFNLYGAQSNAK